MNFGKKNKWMAFTVAGLFVLTGTYNAVVINSDSHITGDIKFVKRLDEVYGITVHGREVAASVQWQKIAPTKISAQKPSVIQQTVSQVASAPSKESAPVEDIPAAAVTEELSMNLVEVVNPAKWQQGIPAGSFSGSLSTRDGIIESLSVSLPGSDGLSVSFSEMKGNVFEYDMNGELYSGMMYQVDQSAYMVTLTNGPLEGTRLRFTTAPSPEVQQAEVQQALAESNIEVGAFGSEVQAQELSPEQMMQQDQQMQMEAAQAQPQGFNLEAQAM